MNPEKIYLHPHPIWEVMDNINSFEDYKKCLPATELQDNVDEIIKDYYKPIQKLLIFGYFEYSFITIAVRNALQMLELVLRHYYNKYSGKIKNNKTQHELILWFEAKKLIDEDQAQLLQQYREFRNQYAHPSTNSVVTLNYIRIVDSILKITNELAGK